MARGIIKDPDIDADYVRSLLSYDPESGILRWVVDRRGKAMAGDEAGHIVAGYRRIKIVKRSVCAHRLAWLIMTGEWPPLGLDHKDTCGTNNAWSNLRIATGLENARNKSAHRDNTSGYKGVYRYNGKRGTRYLAAITVNYKSISLGSYGSSYEAHLAYEKATKEYHGEFGRAA